MTFDTVLFDLDDTLHDRKRTLCRFIDLLILRYSDVLDYNGRMILKDVFTEVDNKGFSPRDEVFTALQNRVPWKYKPDINELHHFWNTEFPKCAEPVPGVYNVLDFLLSKNIKMGIVTNGSSDFQNTKINKLNFKKYMKTIIISEEVGTKKPDPEIFRLALSELNSDEEAALFVGDHPVVDVKGANDFGLTSVWISNGQAWNIKDYMPKYIIDNISELRRQPLKF